MFGFGGATRTTSRYNTTNLQMKRDVLEAFWKQPALTLRRRENGGRRRNCSPSSKVCDALSGVRIPPIPFPPRPARLSPNRSG
jgi:hypothetical protein